MTKMSSRKALLLGALVLICAFAVVRLGGSIFSFYRFQRAHSALRRSASQVSPTSMPAALRFVRDPEPAPFFSLHDIAGRNISTADGKGKVVILNFWATWCPPCREEIPALIALQSQYQSQLLVIGVSEDEDGLLKVAQFAQKMGINYPLVMATDALIAEYGGVPALPTSFLIDPQGRIVQRHTGLYDYQFYEREVRALAGLSVDAPIERFADVGQVFRKNAANATELPDVGLALLTRKQKKEAHHRLNAESCTCGCKLTVAVCRVNDSTCPVSKVLATEVVDQVRTGAPTPIGPQAEDR